MKFLTEKVQDEPDFFPRALAAVRATEPHRYLPWDHLRNHRPPAGLTTQEWWLISKVMRQGMQRQLPLTATDGRRFTYALPDEVLRGIEVVDKHLSGRIGVPEPVTHDAPSRARYVVTSLIEEAITSSQLEGASTNHRVAKEMLRSGRRPRTRGERMILNNYHAMQRVGEHRNETLTPALICELHRIVTEGTMEDPASEGRFQLAGENRVVVEDNSDGSVLHEPPPAEELPERLQRLCDFANGTASGDAYVPPVIRSIVIHFMLAYDHPFADGNGRTARVLFYWSMLDQDYWLTEFLPISRLLRQAPAKYGRSFLYSEQDEGDLTYFIIYQLGIIQRAITDLQTYLTRKVAESKRVQESLTSLSRRFNYRQVALLGHAINHPLAQYTVQSHSRSHNVVPQTARTDLQDLERQGLLTKSTLKRGYAWAPAKGLHELLDPTSDSVGRHRRRGRLTPTPSPVDPAEGQHGQRVRARVGQAGDQEHREDHHPPPGGRLAGRDPAVGR
ncbi:MAG: Fic family protein [Streptosporangiaceae bacterium]